LKRTEVIISGLGGQGVILAGQILGKAAVYDGKNAVQTQSYGAEARGSAAQSEVIISDGSTGFPVVRKCDILVAMSQEALDKNAEDLKEGGRLIVDSLFVKKIPNAKAKTIQIPATETAEKTFGSRICANMIMLGAVIKATRVVSPEAVRKAIEDTVSQEFVNTNLAAFEKGIELVQ